MIRWTAVAAAALVASLATSPSMFAAQRDRAAGTIGITVYQDINFKGRSATFLDDTPDLEPSGMIRQISSLKVAPGETWQVCERQNYQGRCQIFTGLESDLRRGGWSDVISSLRRVRSGGGNGPDRGRPGLELFTGGGFAGPSRVFTTAVSNLQDLGFNDRAMSLRVGPGEVWEVCADKNFRNCVQVTRDMPDLNSLGMMRVISSIRPIRLAPAPPERGAGIILYMAPQFRGQSMIVSGPMTALGGFANRVQSVQVTGGSWQLCDRPNFQGRCVNVSSNLSSLSFVGLDRVASVRPARR